LSPAERSRRFAIGVAAWVFGLAATVFLGGIWGRAVVVDTNQLANTLSPLAASELVAGRISTWLESELVAAAGVDESEAAAVAGQILAHDAVGPVVEELVVEGVEAAASADPDDVSVDVAAILVPATGQITAGLNQAGVPVTEEQVSLAFSGLDPIAIRDPADEPLIGADSPLATSLGTAAVLGALLMLLSGSAHVFMSRDRVKAFRSLATRLALGALSFAVILRIGAWLADPEGGRAPFRESIALLADSKWMVPLTIGLAAAGAALVLRIVRRTVRPAATSR
jgi:hypothetical protein